MVMLDWFIFIWIVVLELFINSLTEASTCRGTNWWLRRSLTRNKRSAFTAIDTCAAYQLNTAEIDTMTVYQQMSFDQNEIERVNADKQRWLRRSSYGFWDNFFEDRFIKIQKTAGPELKVFVVPFSHTEPLWHLSLDSISYASKTHNILNNIVQKLEEFPDLTFIWSEISSLSSWWNKASPEKQQAFNMLVESGRLEITTGSWSMADEACTHIYSLLDQFIEGHLWVKDNLNIAPKTGWSIDSFGHGPTVPYILEHSGTFMGTVIQRIHYAWKHHLAYHQIKEFYWLPGWYTERKPSLFVHNLPFDHYSIKHSCGPFHADCAKFDFRNMTDSMIESNFQVSDKNLDKMARRLMDQYGRVATVSQHNVVLIPLGGDFLYDDLDEFDSQFRNYMKLFLYINNHKHIFNAYVQFGTPLDYFKTVKKRYRSIPSLKGDFFPYSETYVQGKPAYWSGFYTTRPYFKILVREFEHQLRTSEILFTIVYNYMRQSNKKTLLDKIHKSYLELINARRMLGLVQHHNVITGTSPESVIHKFGSKVLANMKHCLRLQEVAISAMMFSNKMRVVAKVAVHNKIEWKGYGEPAKVVQVSHKNRNVVIVFNPLMEMRTEVISVSSNKSNIKVYDTFRKEFCRTQITPMMTLRSDGRHKISEYVFDVFFVANLPPLTAVTFKIELVKDQADADSSLIFCNQCTRPKGENFNFGVHKLLPGNIRLKNNAMGLLIDKDTGLLKEIYRKDVDEVNDIEVTFGVYHSAQGSSGAFLFKPNSETTSRELLNEKIQIKNTIMVTGPIYSEVITLFALTGYPYFVHKIKIFHIDDYLLSCCGILIENLVNFEAPENNTDTEIFMQIESHFRAPHYFFTDQNGFQYQKRVYNNKVGIEGNYYPMTTMAWLEDNIARVTVLTNHAQGVSSHSPGQLEIMLDRRTQYDDERGLRQGVTDNKRTLFQNWLLLESFTDMNFVSPIAYELPSAAAENLSRRFNYPPNVYIVNTEKVGGGTLIKSAQSFTQGFPSGLHLVNLRTVTDDILGNSPSPSCLMILQLPGRTCAVGKKIKRPIQFTEKSKFTGLRVKNLTAMALTGIVKNKALSSLEEIDVEPMEIKTYKILFGTYEYQNMIVEDLEAITTESIDRYLD